MLCGVSKLAKDNYMSKDIRDQVYWYTKITPQATPLDRDLAVDAVVIGGGVAGLTAAQKIRESGLDVAIIESSFCGGGASGKSSGFITPDSELELSDFVENYGPEKAKKMWGFVLSGVEQLRKNILDYNLSCDYQIQDSLFVANSRSGLKKVIKENMTRKELGYESTLYPQGQVPRVLNSKKYFGAVRYSGTFGMNGSLYCQQMKAVLEKMGVKIFEQTKITKISNASVEAGQYKIKAKHIIVCTDHFMPALGILKKEVYHAQTFLTLSKPLSDAEVKKIFPDQKLMVWDTDLIYQYYRITGENRLLFGAASVLFTYLPYEVRKPDTIINKVQKYLDEKFPDVHPEIEYIWPGMIGVSKDFVPLAGRHESMPNVYYVSGAAGIPWATALGMYISEKIDTGRSDLDADFTAYREYSVSNWLQTFIPKPIAFAISHGIAKYLRF